MESNIGFFGQFKYVFKGITKPRFFNRLTNQPNGKAVAYTILMGIVCAVIYWGIIYLQCLGGGGYLNQLKMYLNRIPNFTYGSGQVKFEETAEFKTKNNTNFIFDSSVQTADWKYTNRVQIMSDWVNGVEIYTFNGSSLMHIGRFGGKKGGKIYRYNDIFKILNLPANFDKAQFINIVEQRFPFLILIAAGVSLIPIIATAFLASAISALLAFIGVKIIKQPYTYKELFRIALYITGITSVLKSLIAAFTVGNVMKYFLEDAFKFDTGLIPLLIIFVVIGAVYLFFAAIGSTEEAGPSSTIVFNKPSADRLSSELAPPDPFERKNFSASATETLDRNTRTVQPAPTPVVPSAPKSAPTQFTAKAADSAPKAQEPPKTSFIPQPAPKTEEHTLFHAQSEEERVSSLKDTSGGYSDFGKASKTAAASSIFTTASLAKETQPKTTFEPVKSTPAPEPAPAPQPSILSNADISNVKDSLAEKYAKMAVEPKAEPEPAPEPEPQVTYEEPAPVYEEPASSSAIQKSDTMSFEYTGSLGSSFSASSNSSSSDNSAVVKSDITSFGGVGFTKKTKPKFDRPITAPDAYNGLYYSGSDNEESYESNYGSGTLLDRGGLYGKTIGGTDNTSNPFASVLGAPQPTTTSTSTFSPKSTSSSSVGSSRYSTSNSEGPSDSHLTFTTKSGNAPFDNGGFYLSNPPRNNGDTSSTTVKKGGKTVNRYSDDDFAKWEREAYADEFNKPRGGFGNNIF